MQKSAFTAIACIRLFNRVIRHLFVTPINYAHLNGALRRYCGLLYIIAPFAGVNALAIFPIPLPGFSESRVMAQDFGGSESDLSPLKSKDNRLTLPPSWRTPDPKKRKTGGLPPHLAVGREDREVRQASAFSWVPEVAFGVGTNIPDIVPLDAHLIFGKWLRLRLFYGPQIPFKARVEMPTDVISTKNGIAVANPDFIIRMNALYGPSYGIEGLVFPMGNSFFVSGGMSSRTFKLDGSARSSILVCSNIEAAKEPPCGDPDARLTTRTELVVGASTKTQSTLLRLSTGWLWQVGESGFFSIYAGAAKPVGVKRSVSVTTGVDSKGGEGDDAITGALAKVKEDKEAELEDKAIAEIAPFDQKIVPILGIGGGIQF